jgi:hypothetical protein
MCSTAPGRPQGRRFRNRCSQQGQHCSSLQARTPCTEGGHIKIKNSWSTTAPSQNPPLQCIHPAPTLLHPEREGLISQRCLSSALLPKAEPALALRRADVAIHREPPLDPVFYHLGVRHRCRCYEQVIHLRNHFTPPVPETFSRCALETQMHATARISSAMRMGNHHQHAHHDVKTPKSPKRLSNKGKLPKSSKRQQLCIMTAHYSMT